MTLYTDALAATGIPDRYDPAIARAEQLKSELDELQRTAGSQKLSFSKLISELQVGEVNAAELVERLDRERDEVQRVEQAMSFANGAIGTLKRDKQHALTEVSNIALDYLREQLVRIHGDVVTVAEMLGSVCTAEDAITRGLGEPWSQLRTLASEYRDLRTAQRKLMYPNALVTAVGDIPELERGGWIRGLDFLELMHQEIPRQAPNLPYPTRDGRPEITPDYMRWLAGIPLADDGDGVGVWLPTGSELTEELARRGERLDARRQLRTNPFLSEDARTHLDKVACGRWEQRASQPVFIVDRSAVPLIDHNAVEVVA